jgi:hypothetical protein
MEWLNTHDRDAPDLQSLTNQFNIQLKSLNDAFASLIAKSKDSLQLRSLLDDCHSLVRRAKQYDNAALARLVVQTRRHMIHISKLPKPIPPQQINLLNRKCTNLRKKLGKIATKKPHK